MEALISWSPRGLSRHIAKPPIFFSDTIFAIVLKFAHIMDTYFTNLRLFFQRVFIISTCLYLCVRRCVPIWSVEALHPRSFSSSSTNGFLEVHPSGGQRNGSQRVLNRNWRDEEGEQSTPLLQLPPLCADWCADWCCHAGGGLDSSSCLVQPFEFFVLTSLKSAYMAVNWLWHLSSTIPLTRFMYFPRSRCRGWSAPAGPVTKAPSTVLKTA